MEAVIFDLETTGLSPERDEIIQIAAVRMVNGMVQPHTSFSTFVNPGRPLPTFITGYTGITEAQVRRAPPPAEALAAFARFAGHALLVAHNGHRFDIPFVRCSCARSGLPTGEASYTDSIFLSRRIWGGRGGHGLDAVLQRLGIRGDGVRRHDARGDVHLLAEAVTQMWSRLPREPGVWPAPTYRCAFPAAGRTG